MAYQSFPWQDGDSNSFKKLVQLYLPTLRGKTFLDVGCNTGFFCGWAAFQKAAYVKGVDSNATFIASAQKWFPSCSFSCISWESLGTQTYDIILYLSALHYAHDQQWMVDELMRHVKRDGLLVLELGIAPGAQDAFIEVQRTIDTRFFPTQTKLCSMLEKYAFKKIGPSVAQAGDPLPRYVYHVQHKKPVAVLLMDSHYSGKTSVAKQLFMENIKRIHGDGMYTQILSDQLTVDARVKHLLRAACQGEYLDSSTATANICQAGLLANIVNAITSLTDGQDFVLDHYIPVEYREGMCTLLHEAGYFVLPLFIWQNQDKDWKQQRLPLKCYTAYLQHLEKQGLIQEDEYLAVNPDVAKAVAEKRMPNAQYHYFHFGRREGRKVK